MHTIVHDLKICEICVYTYIIYIHSKFVCMCTCLSMCLSIIRISGGTNILNASPCICLCRDGCIFTVPMFEQLLLVLFCTSSPCTRKYIWSSYHHQVGVATSSNTTPNPIRAGYGRNADQDKTRWVNVRVTNVKPLLDAFKRLLRCSSSHKAAMPHKG